MALHDLEHAAKDIANSPEVLALAASLGTDRQMRAEAAGIAIGSYLANPFSKYRHELLAAGLLVGAAAVNHHDLDRWIREGFLRASGGAESDPNRAAWLRVVDQRTPPES
jgi:hypothetical protein